MNPNGTLAASALLDETLETMEEDLRVPRKVAKDFMESMTAVIEEHLENCEDVVVGSIVRLKPDFVLPKPKRNGTNPKTGESVTIDAKPATLRVKVAAHKRVKDALPNTTTKNAKELRKIAQERKDAADARAKEKAAQEAAAAAEEEATETATKSKAADKPKASSKKKASGKKKGGKK